MRKARESVISGCVEETRRRRLWTRRKALGRTSLLIDLLLKLLRLRRRERGIDTKKARQRERERERERERKRENSLREGRWVFAGLYTRKIDLGRKLPTRLWLRSRSRAYQYFLLKFTVAPSTIFLFLYFFLDTIPISSLSFSMPYPCNRCVCFFDRVWHFMHLIF